jgi:hypothetical protein
MICTRSAGRCGLFGVPAESGSLSSLDGGKVVNVLGGSNSSVVAGPAVYSSQE